MGIQVTWQPGGGATPGGPGVEFHLAPGQDTTAPIPFIITVGGGWGGSTPGYSQGYNMQAKPPSNSQLVQLFDAFGNPTVGFITAPAQGGIVQGAARVRVFGTSGAGPFVDVGLMAYELAPGVFAGGLSNNLRVHLAAAPPTAKDLYEAKVNGASMGYTFEANTSDSVTFHRNAQMVWPNMIPGGR